jgi:hypothetical protein
MIKSAFVVFGLAVAMLVDAQRVVFQNPNDPSLDTTGPTVTITTPTSSSTYDNGSGGTLATLAGTSTGGAAICRWSNDQGGSGTATTSADGSWTVSSISLAEGDNALTVTCVDSGNNTGSDVLTVSRDSVSCDETLSAGADVDAAYAAVADGVAWTICLNSGTYSGTNVAFANETRTSAYVTIRSVSGVGATLSGLSTNNVDYLRISSVTINAWDETGCSTHVEVLDSTFVQGGEGPFINEGSCGAQAILFDGNVLTNVDLTYADERMGVEGGANGITISNNLFSNTVGCTVSQCASGGIMLGGGQNIIIEMNTFDRLTQSVCDADSGQHCDAIQCFGGCDTASPNNTIIRKNYFINGDTYIMAPDHSIDLLVEDNVFNECAVGYSGPVQIGQNSGTQDGAIFRHNTLGCGNVGIAGSNGLVENNIFFSGAEIDFAGGGGCSGCTRRYNLFTDSGDQSGTNVVIGSPQWLGGTWSTIPSTWAGFLLNGGSPGENAGNDGQDMGTRYYGS